MADTSRKTIAWWSAAVLAAALAAWAWQVWSFYLPRGIFSYWYLLRDISPVVTRFTWKPWWFDLIGGCILTFAAISNGAFLLERAQIEIADDLEHAFLSAGTGFSALVLAAASLGLIASFRPVPLRVLLILFALLAIPRAAREARRLRDTARAAGRAIARLPGTAVPLVLAVIFTVFGLTAAAAPEISYDALVGYFPYTALFLQRGTFYLIEMHRSQTPLYGIVFYALGIATHGESAARLLNFLTFPGLLTGVAVLTRAIAPRSRVVAPSLAVFFAASCPTLLHQSTMCLPDLMMALCCLFALVAMLRHIQTADIRWAALSGLFTGMAAGTKYAGLSWVAMMGLAILLQRRPWKPTLRAAIAFSVVAFVVFSPWLIRNWINTGDPLHPSFQKYLSHPAIDVTEAQDQMEDGMNRNRLPFTPANILAMPWRITMDGGLWLGTVGPVFLWTLPFMYLGYRRDRAWIAAAFALPLFALLWFAGPQWARYFLPGIPVAAALAAAGLCHERFPVWIRVASSTVAIVFGLVNLPCFNQAWVGGGTNSLAEVPFETSFGRSIRDQYLTRSLPGFTAVKFLNAQSLPNSTTVIPVPALSFFPPWISRMNVLDIWDNGHVVCQDARQKPVDCYTITGRALRQNIDLAGVDVLVVRRDADWAATRLALRLEDPFLRANFRLLGYGGGAFHFLRNRAGTEPGQSYVNADLISRFATGTGFSGDAANIHITSVLAPGSDERWSLLFERPAEAKFDVQLGNAPRLSFFAGWEAGRAADFGSQIIVEANGRTVFTNYFSPEDAPRGWIELNADLAAFANQRITLAIRTQPNEGAPPGRVALADPVIYSRETDEPFVDASEPGSQWRFSTATTRHPVVVRFIPAEIHPGEAYVMEIPELANAWIDLLIAAGDGLPEPAMKFRHLDAQGRTTVHLPATFKPMTVQVRGARKSGTDLWLHTEGKISVVK